MTEPRITAFVGMKHNAAHSIRVANAMLYRLSTCITHKQMDNWLHTEGSNSREWGSLGIADQTAVALAYQRRRKVLG